MSLRTPKTRSVTYSSSLSMLSMAESISWYTSLFLAFMLAMSLLCQGEEFVGMGEMEMEEFYSSAAEVQGWRDGVGVMMIMKSKPCDDIYVVGEGETLQTISDKCGDPYIVENNPHINDPDDVFPGLVIKITPTQIGN